MDGSAVHVWTTCPSAAVVTPDPAGYTIAFTVSAVALVVTAFAALMGRPRSLTWSALQFLRS